MVDIDKTRKSKVLTLVDVYDIAADIGKEFESLISDDGAEKVTQLMQKVIAALEHLEVLVHNNDNEQTYLEDLRRTIEHLELEDTKKNEERIRYARDIEQVEEHFKEDTKDYLTTIKRLQDENRKLSSSLTAATERDSAFSEDESYIEVDLINKLQGILDKQREHIRQIETNLADLKNDMEDIKSQNEKLSNSNKDLRRKFRQSQSQLHCLVDERAELQVAVQDAERGTSLLMRRLGLAAKENEDLARSSFTEPDMRNKIVYDLEDPARPRFTLAELKDILQERNSLKARVSDLEDELELYRPGTRCSLLDTRSSISCQNPAGSCDCAFHSGLEHADHFANAATLSQNSDPDSDCSDLPVQGPLPFEPEDAPWKRAESSGIRKFFRRVFGSDGANSSPQDDQPSSSGVVSKIVEYKDNLLQDTIWQYHFH